MKQTFNLSAFVLASIAYIASFSLMKGFVSPVQEILAPEMPQNVSLLFLPHGVRMLVFFYFGVLGYAYLLPASLLMWFLETYGNHQVMLPFGALLSAVSCHLGVILAKSLPTRRTQDPNSDWTLLLAAGVIGSLFNSVSLTLLYRDGIHIITLVGYLFGDTLGQLALMFLLIAFARVARTFNALGK